MKEHKRVLIVGTVPYNEMSTSRAFDSYFHFWEKQNLAQIFSNAKAPVKGHCGTLFQITDARLLKRRFRPDVESGVIYNYDQLEDKWQDSNLEVSPSVAKLYQIGSHKSAAVYILRKIIWKKKYWCTEKLLHWLDDFQPECVFLSFSDDFFILEIALFVAKRYNIPIVSSIGDDYYFNYKFSLSLLYHIYKLTYRRLVRKIFSHEGSAIYIGDKIRDKYNEYFGLKGKTVYLTSSIKRRPFRPIEEKSPTVSYFGNIRLGRNFSLRDIGRALGRIDKNCYLNVYSSESDPRFYRIFNSTDHVKFCGAIPYEDVQKKTLESDLLIVVEGFEKRDIDMTRYSLSTKVADSLASGVAVFAYGSVDCGAIEYAESTKCITTCTDPSRLEDSLLTIIGNQDLQKKNYLTSVGVVSEHHSLKMSTKVFEELINEVCGG